MIKKNSRGYDLLNYKKNLYCDACKSILESDSRPSEQQWQNFKDCRCLSKINLKGGKNGTNNKFKTNKG